MQYLRNLNIFPSIPPTTNQHDLRTQRISTRLFIVLFGISITILLTYTSSVTINKTIILQNPDLSQFKQLYQLHTQTISCPCKQISIENSNFLQVNYTLHQVCNSIYVTNDWILFLIRSNRGSLLLRDFRVTGRQQFLALSSLCELVQETILMSIQQFYSSNYISSHVVPISVIQTESKALVQQFITSTTNGFLLSLQTVRETTQANSLLSALLTNYKINIYSDTSLGFAYKTYDNSCSCALSSVCSSPARIYNNNNRSLLWYVPGFYMGCFVLESMRQSDLRCLYDYECLTEMIYQINSTLSINSSTLQTLPSGQFDENTTLGTILDELMVEEWSWFMTYENYFSACSPTQCSYTITTKNDPIYIITALIGLLGGLVAALRLIVPKLVGLFRNRTRITVLNVGHSVHRWMQSAVRYMKELNLFQSTPPSTDLHILRTEILSTRLFIGLLTFSLSVLIVYISTIRISKTVTITFPNIVQYKQLYEQYKGTLSCPCSQLSIDYDTFLQINYTLHPICNSSFITDQWISFIANLDLESVSMGDFRYTAPNAFLAIGSMCRLADKLILNNIMQFYATNYINAFVTSVNQFESQTKSLIEQFISSIANSFLLLLQTIRETTQANALLSAGSTNGLLYIPLGTTDVRGLFRTYDMGCSCSLDVTCSSPARFFINNSVSLPWFIPGFYTGCFVIEALRKSDFSCFYNQTCVQDFISKIDTSQQFHATPLQWNDSSRFQINTSIGEILDVLMVDQWDWSTVFERYFGACNPSQCSYTRTTRNDVIYIITTVIGLIGGLVTGLRLIVPRIANIILKFVRRRKELEVKIEPRPNVVH